MAKQMFHSKEKYNYYDPNTPEEKARLRRMQELTKDYQTNPPMPPRNVSRFTHVVFVSGHQNTLEKLCIHAKRTLESFKRPLNEPSILLFPEHSVNNHLTIQAASKAISNFQKVLAQHNAYAAFTLFFAVGGTQKNPDHVYRTAYFLSGHSLTAMPKRSFGKGDARILERFSYPDRLINQWTEMAKHFQGTPDEASEPEISSTHVVKPSQATQFPQMEVNGKQFELRSSTDASMPPTKGPEVISLVCGHDARESNARDLAIHRPLVLVSEAQGRHQVHIFGGRIEVNLSDSHALEKANDSLNAYGIKLHVVEDKKKRT